MSSAPPPLLRVDESVVDGAGVSREQPWAEAYGARWRAHLLVLGVLVAVLGATAPLSDPDLPIHLATGEWIVRHGAVPFAEPFAWTRAGQPFQAYSWAIETLYYLVLRATGPLGLRALNGVLFACAGAAVLALGQAARWRPTTTLLMAMLNLTVATLIACCTRPQLVLFALVPLAWAATYRVLAAERIRWAALALFLVSATAANTHLLFPLTATPWVLLLADPPRAWRRATAVVGAVVLGWLASPYALRWPEIFRLNFAPNALIAYPSPLTEYWPGFVAATRTGLVPLLIVLFLAALPWALAGERVPPRRAVLFGALWLVGLVGFALAARALLVWWLVSLPVAAIAVDRVARALEAETPLRRHGRILALWALCAAFLLLRVSAVRATGTEGTVTSRTLPTPAGPFVDPLAAWLECNARPGAGGRLFTIHGFGTYLIWRLPSYSPSIDGRTIFADSIAAVDAYRRPGDPEPGFGPWASADVAIVPMHFAVAAVLDTAAGWRRVAVADGERASAGLWVTDRWWEANGRSATPPAAGVCRAARRPAASAAEPRPLRAGVRP